MEPAAEVTDGAVFGERFQCVKPLKFGRGTTTWLGHDAKRGESVLIKTASLTALGVENCLRLEHEAAVLGELARADFTPVIAVGRQEGVTYVVMPFVPGITLRERLGRGRLSVPEVLVVGRALSRALERAHERGILHRDVKPSNIIVNECPVVSRATLIDFGFACSPYLDHSLRDIPLGTVQYLAPEQAGLLSRPVDERADLYAMGAVLFECGAGRPPFTGKSVGEILRAHLIVQPPALRGLGHDVPRALDEVIQRLLRKDPDDRYQTAEAVRADLEDISDALARGVGEPAVVVGLRDRRRTLAEPAFVGRDRELALLDGHLAAARQGRGGLVLVEAESGGGKTRLLEEFARRSARAGAWVLRGQGVDHAAVRPFQLLDGVLQGILARFDSDSAFFERLKGHLGEQCEAVCEVAPQLAGYLGRGSALSLGQEAHGEVRSLRALTALLDGLGTPDSPAAIVFDDVQWVDELTLRLLERWARGSERVEARQGSRHVLVVAAFRTEEVSPDHRLRGVPALSTLGLASLTGADLRRLLESMAGRLPDEAVNAVEQLAEGSPFMATAVLQGLVESGALVANHTAEDGSGWTVNREALADIRSSQRAAVFLARRLDRLPEPALKLLSVGAVLGKEFGLSLAGDLAGLPDYQAADSCREAGRRHLIWIHENGARCVFVHDKIREAVLARLSDDERRALHAAAATKIEEQDPGRIFELAYHFDAAGQQERALRYALQAAEQARARYALEVAEQHYRIASRGVGAEDLPTRARVAEGLGDVLMLRGRYDEAEQQLRTAAECAGDRIANAYMALKMGELTLKRGDVKGSSEVLRKGLRLLGRFVPKRLPTFLLLAVWEALVQSLHTLFPSVFVGRRTLTHADDELLAIRLYSRLAYAYYFTGPIHAIWAHFREMNLAERYPPSRELAQAYSNHAPCMGLIGWFERGLRYAYRSLEIRTGFGDLWGQGQSLSFSGYALLCLSRLPDALQALQSATRLLDRAGDRWEANNASLDVAATLFRLGKLNAAVELSQRTYKVGLETGELKARTASLDYWARASGGKVDRALTESVLGQASDDIQASVQALQAESLRLLGDNQPLEAAEVLERAWYGIRKSRFRSEEVVSVPAWLATALRTAAERAPQYAHEARNLLIWRLKKSSRHALRLARRYRNNLPHALREAGLLAAMTGRPRKARRCLDESLAVAEQQGAKFEHAQTLLARGQVGSALGWPEAADDLDRARVALRALGAYWVLGEDAPTKSQEPATPALIERFDTVLTSGRQIARALTRPAVYAAVRDAALALLRGEACLVLEVDGVVSGGDVPHVRVVSCEPPQDARYSRTVVERAMETGRPVAASDGVSEATSESLVLAGVRSVLCAPIMVRGRAIGCFYVTHRQVGGLFGPDEERLAEFIATLAGAALENVEGLAKTESELIASSAAGLAHAIKNPVAVIRAYLGLLRGAWESHDGPRFDRYLETMAGAVGRIEELAGRLNGMRTGKPRQKSVVLERLLHQATEEIRPLFPEAQGYRIGIDRAPDAPACLAADEEQLRLVLVNLLSNACQAMPRGGRVLVTIRPGEGRQVVISVADQGSGMTAAIESRLFQPFVTTKSDGTGLGLWVCKKIIEAHRGRIEVASTPGVGTTVRLTLPVGHETDVPSD